MTTSQTPRTDEYYKEKMEHLDSYHSKLSAMTEFARGLELEWYAASAAAGTLMMYARIQGATVGTLQNAEKYATRALATNSRDLHDWIQDMEAMLSYVKEAISEIETPHSKFGN